MARHKLVKVHSDRNALSARQPANSDLTRFCGAINSREVFFRNEMDLIIDRRILTYSPLKGRFNDFADKLDRHPTFSTRIYIFKCLWRSTGTHVRDNPIEIMISLRNADEASNLPNSVTFTANDCDARRNAFELADTHRCTADRAYVT